MRLLHEIAIFQTVKSKVIISLFETVRLSISISLRNLYNSLKRIKENCISGKQMKGGAHLSPFNALSFPNSKKGAFTTGLTESIPVVGQRSPGSTSRPSGVSLHHNQVALTTRIRRLTAFSQCFYKSRALE